MSLSTIAGLPVTTVAEHTSHINMLIYGDSGVGKTTLACSADLVPEMRKVLVVDIEGGLLSVKDEYPDVNSVRVKTWEDMQRVYEALRDQPHGYQTVIIDSLSEAQKMSMDLIMKKLVEQHEERSEDVAGIREWNINIEQTRKFVRAFRDLPITTIFTALTRTDVNKMNGAQKTKPALSGKVADEVAAFLDIVGYLYPKEIEGENRRLLLCQATQNNVAKDRTKRLGQVLFDPTMSDIWKAVKGNINNDAAVEG